MSKTLFFDAKFGGYVDLQKNELKNVRLENLVSDISGPLDGLIFYRSDTNKIRARINGAWADLATTNDIAQAGLSANLFDFKGDLLVGTGPDSVGREAVGANNTFYVADSSQATGHVWRVLSQADLTEKIGLSDLTDWPRVTSLDLNGQRITNVQDGSASSDVVTYGQFLAVIEGKRWKDPVVAATTANIVLSGTQTIDGVAVVTGDRVLVKNQTAPAENGIYIVGAGGWTRATDANTAAELSKATVIVSGGSLGQGDVFSVTNTITTLGTDAVTITKTGEGNSTYTSDGATIVLTGNSFGVPNGGIGSNQLAGGAVTAAKMAASSVDLASTVPTGTLPLAKGGTGGTDAPTARTSLGAPGKVTGSLTGGAVSEVLTHNLNTRAVMVSVRNNAAPYDEVEVENEATTVNTVTIRGAANLPAGYTWVVIG